MSAHIECPSCGGHGMLYGARHEHAEESDVFDCPTCDGDGNVFGHVACGWAFDAGMREAEQATMRAFFYSTIDQLREVLAEDKDAAVAAERERCLAWIEEMHFGNGLTLGKERKTLDAYAAIRSGAPAPRETPAPVVCETCGSTRRVWLCECGWAVIRLQPDTHCDNCGGTDSLKEQKCPDCAPAPKEG